MESAKAKRHLSSQLLLKRWNNNFSRHFPRIFHSNTFAGNNFFPCGYLNWFEVIRARVNKRRDVTVVQAVLSESRWKIFRRRWLELNVLTRGSNQSLRKKLLISHLTQEQAAAGKESAHSFLQERVLCKRWPQLVFWGFKYLNTQT